MRGIRVYIVRTALYADESAPMLAAVLLAAIVASPSPVVSGSPAARLSATLDNVSLGQPISAIRERAGDPVAIQELPNQAQRIWRFLENGNRFLDVLERDGVAISITVAKYAEAATFTDQRGVPFGAASDDVAKAMGQPQNVTRNTDDGSVDFWYRSADAVLIYEFLNDRLVFEQVLAPRDKLPGYTGAPSIEPREGTSTADAITVSPPADAWIRAYFALNACGAQGRWQTVSARQLEKGPTYEVVHASCSGANITRDFYFLLPAAGASA